MRRVLLMVALLSCGSPPTGLDEKPTVASGQLGLVRQVSWPGGGTELTIKVSSPEGDPMGTAEIGTLLISMGTEALADEALQVSPQVLAPGMLALLVYPAASETLRRAQAEALETFIGERPSEERIGIFLWRQRVEQLANFTRDRTRLATQLDKLAGMKPASEPVDAQTAVLDAEERVFSVEGKEPRVLRAIVVHGADVLELPPTRAAVAIGLDGAAARLDAFATSSYFQVNVCSGRLGGSAELEVLGLDGVLPVFFAPALPESASQECDVSQMGLGLRTYPEALELVFSEAQREVYDERVSALSKSDFDLSVRLDGAAEITATAHLRGKGTLGCERKSYTLSLDGPGRHLLPRSRTDEFYLLSMCADDRYVQQFTANQLMKELGLFPLEFRLIETLLDGETQGVYLLLEKPREELVRDGSGIHGVMRRRFNTNPPEDFFESKFDTGVFGAAEQYAVATSDMSLLSKQVDLQQYLGFLALMTAYQNGDYIDEIWVTASEQRSADDTANLWFETMAWDNDDLFSECHYTGKFAFEDDNELVYCAEAAIDHFLLSDAMVYSRYVDTLENLLLTQVTPERFEAALEATEEAIMPILSKPGVSAAMVRLVEDNPAAIDPDEAKREVMSKLENLRTLYRERHAGLLERIATYRGAQQ